MTDKEYKTQKERVRKLIKKWVDPLGLRWYRISFEYFDFKRMDDGDYHPKTINGIWETAFSVHTDPYYCTAKISCYLPTLQDITDEEEFEEYFIHELMHIFLRPMHSEKYAKEEELVATKLAQAFLWTEKRVRKQYDKTKKNTTIRR